MKTILLFLTLAMTIGFGNAVNAQNERYFRFYVCPESANGNWQDTSFVAWTNDQNVINDALAQLALPYADRSMFPAGDLLPGDGGYNCNAGFCFSWHLDPNNWALAEMAIGVCSACPYTDVETNSQYWLDNVGGYCPMSAKIVEELPPGSVGLDDVSLPDVVSLYPNPSEDVVNIQISAPAESIEVVLTNVLGEVVLAASFDSNDAIQLDLSQMDSGQYIAAVTVDGAVFKERVVKF